MKKSLLFLVLWLAAVVSGTFSVKADGTSGFSMPGGFADLVKDPSPDVAALNRHIDCPVSFSTGSFNISIPLFSWEENGFPISLTLDYHPGIKAQDKAGRFGLGWSLGGLTGTISRQIIGLPDESEKSNLPDDMAGYLNTLDVLGRQRLASGEYDSYADKYYYSVTGYSGCFLLRNGNVIDLSDSGLTIIPTFDPTDGNSVSRFTITTPEGWVYKLEATGKTKKTTFLRKFSYAYCNTDYEATSLWCLTELTFPDKVSKLNVTYATSTDVEHETPELYSIQLTENGLAGDVTKGNLPPDSVAVVHSGSPEITGMTGQEAKISFQFINNGLTCVVKNRHEKEIRRIEFAFDNTQPKRKKLISLTILSDNEILDRREFTYHADSYSPNRTKACSDFFGYSNRNEPFSVDTIKTWHSLELPGGTAGNIGDVSNPGGGSGSGFWSYETKKVKVNESIFTTDASLNPHRKYNFDHAQSASLKSMTDVNGLITSITYEPNRAPLIVGRDTFDVNIGIRVKEISTSDPLTGRSRKRSFGYSDPQFSIPLEALRVTDFLSHAGSVTITFPNQPHPAQSTVFASSCRVPGMSAENAVILYGKVEETISGTALSKPVRTLYEFDHSHSVCAAFGITPGVSDSDRSRNGDYYLGYGVMDNSVDHRLYGKADVSFGFSERFYQKSPLVRRTDYEADGNGGYRITDETLNFYSYGDSVRIPVGIYCERLRRSVINLNQQETFNDGIGDFSTGVATVISGRTYCDSTVTIKHYPDGSSRRMATRYIYNDRESTTLDRFPEVADSEKQAGRLHRPTGRIITCLDSRLEEYELLSDNFVSHSAFGATAASCPATLPVWKKTVVNGDDFTTKITYRSFNNSTYPLPWRMVTYADEGLEVVDSMTVTAYNAALKPTRIVRHAAPTMLYAYSEQGNGPEPVSKTIEGTSLTTLYEHIPLIGCTAITSPAGTRMQYEYSGSRLRRILDSDDNPLKEYQYALFSPDDYTHTSLRERIFLAPGGSSAVASRKIFDSYGVEYASVSENASAPGEDIVSYATFDALDRPVRQYLPYVASSGMYDEDIIAESHTRASEFYSDSAPFSSLTYPAGSPSATPATAVDAGSDRSDWTTGTDRLCNSTTDPLLRCIRYAVQGNYLTSKGYWPAGSLDVTVVTDPDGGKLIEFQDFLGRKILSRQLLDDNTALDTYTIYDNSGNVRMVLPPMASDALRSLTLRISINSDDVIKDYAFCYAYDSANRLIYKKLPGADRIMFGYDADGLPAMTQDGNMRAAGQAMFTLYDKACRPVVTGLCDASMMTGCAGVRMRARYDASDPGVDSTYYVTDFTLPGATMLTATYYDAVPVHLSVSCPVASITPVGLVAARTSRVLGEFRRTRVSAVHFYDEHEREVYTSANTADNSLLRTTTEYDFAGNPVKVSKVSYIGFNRFSDVYTYTYDRLNRLSAVTLRHDNADPITIVSNTYDALGRLLKRKSPGKAELTYTYDIRSALTGISSWHFYQTLHRGPGRYPSRTGRITRNEISLTGRRLVSDYRYDRVGRLLDARTILEGYDRDFSESFAYDLNTNIVSLRRYGGISHNANDLVDDITLTYNGNRLLNVTDDADAPAYSQSLDFRPAPPAYSVASPGGSVGAAFDVLPAGLLPDSIPHVIVGPSTPDLEPSSDYTYDANGNMISDRHSAIQSITYNVLNLPQRVAYEGLVLQRPECRIIYDAAGQRHAQLTGYTSQGRFSGDVRLYVGDYIVVNDSVDRLLTPYGYLRDGVFHSYVHDYQGNVTCVVTDDEVLQTNLYYPDGLPMSISTQPAANPFKYTGKELLLFRGYPVYDFTARHTLPALGNIFRSTDPKAEINQHISVYNFCNGDPINYIDPTGMELKYIENVDGLCDEIVKIVNNFLEGTYTFNIDDKGKASLIVNPDSNLAPNKFQQAFIDTFTEIIGNENTTTVILDNNSGSPIGNCETGTINVDDVKKLGDGPVVSAIGTVFHETIEQYLIQIKGFEPNHAHFKASSKETSVTGNLINFNKREINEGTMLIEGKKIIDQNGNNVRPQYGIAFLLLDEVSNKVINVFQSLSE